MRWRNQVRETPNSNGNHHRCRVLVVDDTRGSRALLKASLGQWGIQTVEAVDGMAAWELLQHESFDIVISDYEMPRCSGLQLLAAMRHSVSSITKRLPLILVSSAESGFIRDRIAGIKRTYFLPKPLDIALLHRTLRQLLQCDA